MTARYSFGIGLLGLAIATITASCASSSGGSTSTACAPGAQSACPCAAGGNGTQTCEADGSAFGACSCPSTTTDGGENPKTDSGTLPGDAGCMPETDTAFCSRLGKTCEPVSAPDNCGAARSVSGCGTCSGTTSACVANVCKAPVCDGTYAGTGTTVTSLSNVGGAQDALLGVSGTGGSVLYLHTTVAGCIGANTVLTMADAATVNLPTPPTYVGRPIGSQMALSGFSQKEESMTLTADGLTIVGVATGGKTFLESKRSAVGQVDFSAAAAGSFATVNASIPALGGVAYPVASADGLAFYYQVSGAKVADMNGIYEATRTQTALPFNAGVKMAAPIQAYEAVTGISSDRMSLFVTASFNTTILTRTSLSQIFVKGSVTPPSLAYRVAPVSTCGVLFGTCEPGGCAGETICIWTKH